MISFTDLADGIYESMFVQLDGFQVTSDYLGGALGMSPLFENEDADNLRLMVGEEAAFAVESYRDGAGTVAGIAGGAAAVPGIWPMRKSDVALSVQKFHKQPLGLGALGHRLLNLILFFTEKRQGLLVILMYLLLQFLGKHHTVIFCKRRGFYSIHIF